MSRLIETTARAARALLVWHPSAESLARSILACNKDLFEVGDVTWATFDDGWANTRFAKRAYWEGRDVVFVASLHHPSVVVEQHGLMTALARQRVRSLHIFVPYFGPGTMERVSHENEVATAEPFFKLLTASMPPTARGVPTITVFDAHALCTRFYAVDRVTVVDQSAFSLAQHFIKTHDATIVFPDDGAAKRFAPLFAGYKQLVRAKKRGDGEARHVVYADESEAPPLAAGKTALIVDDLVQSGSTLAECARLLRANFTAVSAFVVHAVFPRDAHKHFLDGGKHHALLDTFLVCNTNPSVSDVLARVGAPFRVLDIAPLIGAQVRSDIGPRVARAAAARIESRRTIFSAVVASRSEVKKSALQRALCQCNLTKCRPATVPDYDCASGVEAQPLSEVETWRGAENRLADLLQHCDNVAPGGYSSGCDFGDYIFVGIESGVWRRDGV